MTAVDDARRAVQHSDKVRGTEEELPWARNAIRALCDAVDYLSAQVDHLATRRVEITLSGEVARPGDTVVLPAGKISLQEMDELMAAWHERLPDIRVAVVASVEQALVYRPDVEDAA